MVKRIIIIILLLFFTGCKVQYNLEIKNKDFKENITISGKKGEVDYFNKNDLYAIMDGASNFQPYKKKYQKKDNILNLSYKYKDLEYEKATVLSSCFSAYNVIQEDNYYILSTSEGIRCMSEENTVLLDKLVITIKTNHKVIDSNADEVDKYKYMWYIDKSNFSKKSIYLKFYSNKYVFNYENEFVIKMCILAVILGLALFFGLRLRRKNKLANKI